MRILQALSHRQIRRLWGGQVFSAVGDEVYGIAMVWYAADLLGVGAGYLSAVQAGAVFFFGLVGGVWMDHRDHRKVMVAADVARGIVVLALPVVAYFRPLTLGILIPAAIAVSSFSAFFNPAMNALLPQLIENRALLQASNGLMETTSRIARVIGPGIVGLLSRFVPLIHYFTLDAVSFFTSAVSVHHVRHAGSAPPHDSSRLSFKETLLVGQRLACSQPVVAYVVFSGIMAASAWMFILPLGMTLLLRERVPANLGALGFLLAAYGVGNITSNVVISNFVFLRPERWMYSGRIIGGIGFAFLSLSSTLEQMMVAAAIAAAGGPLADLGYINLLQNHFRGRDVARVFRYAMAISNGGLLAAFLLSPQLFAHFAVAHVIFASAILILLTGALGFLNVMQ
jgi:DHA3 family macrolide efflux protein-like MFS transporter